MIEWWGPILLEYYAGSEGNGMTFATSQQWLDHPGSVGKPIMGTPHICDAEGNEVPLGEEGVDHALRIIHKELDLTMAFCGHTDINTVDKSILLPGSW